MTVTPELALYIEKLRGKRDALVSLRASGVLSFRDQNGEEVVYKSDRQMAEAMATLDREIADLSGRSAPTKLTFVTSKGT